MKNPKVASRYAKALLELALEQKKIDSVLGDMKFLLRANDESREFELLIASPIIDGQKKIDIFNRIFDQFEDITKSFVKLITENGRDVLLPEIARAFEAKVKEYKGIVPITLITATPLDDATKEQILSKVRATVKGELEIEEKIDESLIGGFVVRMEDKQIDASISSQFNNLKQRLTR